MDWFAELSVDVIVEALLHHLWQGAVIAVLLFVVLRCLPGRRTDVRYGISLVAFGLACAAVPMSLSVVQHRAEQQLDGLVASVQALEPIEVLDASMAVIPESRVSQTLAPEAATSVGVSSEWGWRQICFSLWLIGSVIGIVRVIAAVSGARRLKRSAEPISTEPFLRVFKKVGMRRLVPILSSAQVPVAAVCGLLKPVVLLPLSQLTALSPEQLEAIIAHELAHIRRYDHVVNFFQLIAEALLFFNPCLWWISGQVRAEREACCDAIAVEVTGQKLTYIRTLVDAAEGHVPVGLELAPAFAGDGRSASLLSRVKRLLQPASTPDLHLRLPVVAGLITLSLVGIGLFQLTATVAVQLMTPEERIAEIAELQAVYPDYRYRASSASDPKFTVRGQFLLPGGVVPDERITFYRYSQTSSGQSHISGRTDRSGHFDFTVGNGESQLMAKADGVAPVYHDFGYIEEDVDGVVLELSEGDRAKVRFVDEEGEVLESVKVQGSYDLGPGQNIRFDGLSGADGIANFEHLAHYPVNLKTSSAGYEQGVFKGVTLAEDEMVELRLSRTEPTEIRVVDQVTGEPIAGAEIGLKGRRSSEGVHTYGSPPSVAPSNSQGVVVLDGLRSDTHYYYVAEIYGYAGAVLGPVTAGQSYDLPMLSVKPFSFELRGVPAEWLGEGETIKVNIAPTLKIDDDGGYTPFGEVQQVTVVDGIARFSYLPRYQSEIRVRVNDADFEYTWADLQDEDDVVLIDLTPLSARSKSGLQQVRVRFNVPDGQPPVNGSMIAQHLKYAEGSAAVRQLVRKRVDVLDGVSTFSVPAPNRVELLPEGLTGYWIQRPTGSLRDEVLFNEDGSVFEIEVDAEPAGAIMGNVHEVDGSPARGAHISVFVADVEGNTMRDRSLRVEVKNSSLSHDLSDRYLATPLPVGGVYVICVNRNYTHVLSELIEVTEEQPLHQFDCVLPVGETIAGRILDSEGRPVAYQKTRFSFQPDAGHGFSRDGPMTDAEGRFQIEGLNFDVDGSYYLMVDSVLGHQPSRLKIKSRKREQVFPLKQGYRIVGVVREASTGRVIPGAEVYATRAEYVEGAYPTWFDCENTDAQGRFEFDNLPEGTFEIGSRSGKFVSGYAPSAKAGGGSEVELQIELYKWSGLVPVDAK
ncbi:MULTISPECIES: M56 family metallopeptidase [unclassified Lentimonas]|uniref:M56 family metallopeptidase n=1 Tax=unclassified Lentimonas TaxID=2630993 RepID=UPI00132C869F|nr:MULTISPECIES: M56 family metallopeptidase [unclassified Lentimonas]CAA6678182.1 Unannotated [Lentimonas sp. CC4]CAA6685928.1 Unannotated [Lentimonas sp. CC6]CAA7075982.1 Unannotated [Lentimonas sp. CC4]CAA7168589.1 Unannotated [Lentimonas sp. CC21]CAA7180981.1 Unannotated [Lentimonas sp. CC8]